MPSSSSESTRARRALIEEIKEDKKSWLRHGVAALAVSVLGLGVAGSVALTDGPLRAYTPKTISDTQVLEAEIARVREQGWAKAVGEREPDLAAIAAPIRSSRGELEAIVALPGPSSRFDDRAVKGALPVLRERADAISRELGWRPG